MTRFVSFLFLLTLNLPSIAQPIYKEYSIQAVNYFQVAAEVKALQLQAYEIARFRLDQALVTLPAGKPLAVVVDVDETVLDNSPYQARQILSGESYPKGWKEWVEEANALAIPGSAEFLNYADKKHVAVFYISNRKLADIAATMKNLKAAGFPQVTDDRLLFKSSENGKESRRQKVAEQYEIVLLVGDNLTDFTALFDGQSTIERNQMTGQLKKEFGSRFIMLPNSLYGDWENALYEWNLKADEKEKAELRKKALRLQN